MPHPFQSHLEKFIEIDDAEFSTIIAFFEIQIVKKDCTKED